MPRRRPRKNIADEKEIAAALSPFYVLYDLRVAYLHLTPVATAVAKPETGDRPPWPRGGRGIYVDIRGAHGSDDRGVRKIDRDRQGSYAAVA